MRNSTKNERWENLKTKFGDHGIVSMIEFWAQDDILLSFIDFMERSVTKFEDADGNELKVGDYVMLCDSEEIDFNCGWRVGDVLRVTRLVDIESNEINLMNSNISINDDVYGSMYGHRVKKLYCQYIKFHV